jgi:IS5 family transposase
LAHYPQAVTAIYDLADQFVEQDARLDPVLATAVNERPTLWDAILPAELLVLPMELARVDALLDDPAFFAPFATCFDAGVGRPSIPMETYLRLMLLKFRYRLGYESLCREVADSISWQRFCRLPLGTWVPHPTTLMKITTRCGDAAAAGLNEALLTKAARGEAAGHRPGAGRHHGGRGAGGLPD